MVAMKMEVRDLELAEQAHRFKEMPVEMEQMQAQAAQLVLVVVAVAQAVTSRLRDLVGVLLLPTFFVVTGLRTDVGARRCI